MVWLFPVILTCICIGFAIRPIGPSGGSDYGEILTILFRGFWVVPILVIWLLFFIVMWIGKT